MGLVFCFLVARCVCHITTHECNGYAEAVCHKKRCIQLSFCHQFQSDLKIFVNSFLSSEFRKLLKICHSVWRYFLLCVALLSFDCTLETYEAYFFPFLFTSVVSSDTNPIVSEDIFFSTSVIFFTPKHTYNSVGLFFLWTIIWINVLE